MGESSLACLDHPQSWIGFCFDFYAEENMPIAQWQGLALRIEAERHKTELAKPKLARLGQGNSPVSPCLDPGTGSLPESMTLEISSYSKESAQVRPGKQLPLGCTSSGGRFPFKSLSFLI